MQFGLQLNSQHPATENMRDRLQELLEQVHLAQTVGFHSIVAPQHYLPAPFQMLQPLPLLARMAAKAKQMRLIAGIMLLSLQNPVALAEDIGTEANHSPRKSPSVGSCSSPRTTTRHCAPVCRIWSGSIRRPSPGVSLGRYHRKTRSTSHSTSYAISGSSSGAQMTVWSSCASIANTSGRTIFCCGFNGLGCPKSRYWKRSLSSVSALFHTCAMSSKQMHMRSSHD
jgi:Luciferase-like monooxygenase